LKWSNVLRRIRWEMEMGFETEFLEVGIYMPNVREVTYVGSCLVKVYMEYLVPLRFLMGAENIRAMNK
jgi:hypothetical protein